MADREIVGNTDAGALVGGKYGLALIGFAFEVRGSFYDSESPDGRISASLSGVRSRVTFGEDDRSFDLGFGGTLGVGSGVSVFAGGRLGSKGPGLIASASSIVGSPVGIGGYVNASATFSPSDGNHDSGNDGGLSDNMDSDDPDYDEDGNWIGDGPDPNANSQTPAPPANGRPSSDFTNLDQDGDGFYDGGGNDGAGDGPGSGGKPVVLDLDGDGVELVALEDSTAFYDIDGDGYRERMAWVSPTMGC